MIKIASAVANPGMANGTTSNSSMMRVIRFLVLTMTYAAGTPSVSAKDKQTLVFDPEGETAQYLKALADTRVFFEKQIDMTSLEAILKEAITAEKDSIVFYLGMKDMVADASGKDRIDAIIKEEMGHIRQLSRELAALNK